MASGHHESHGSPYAQDSWGYGQQYNQSHQPHSMSPMHEYGNFDYGHSPMPMEPAYTMPRPPPYAPAHHPLPPPLIMPHNNIWPSMLANQNNSSGSNGNYQTPIMPASGGPIHTPVSAAPSHGSDITPTSAKSTSRRKLTDEERRQMCLEAEQNPTMKQTQIGAKFNVERSTVSKILRQKDKYMKPVVKEEAPSPGKKSKVKLPDVEKTLANWARNQQKKGVPVADEELEKQALMFSAGRTDQQQLFSSGWLEQFKQKHLDGTSDVANLRLETPVDGSPTSSNGLVSPPMSSVDDKPSMLDKLDKIGDEFDFEVKDTNYDSINLPVTLEASGETILSPVSPDLARSDGLGMALSDSDSSHFSFSRARSQTFSHLTEVSSSHELTPNAKVPPLPVRSVTQGDMFKETSIDPRQMMKRHKSVPDIHDAEGIRYATMQPPPLPRSADVSPITNPSSPSAQDENIRALITIKKLLEQRPDVAEPDDYVMIGKLLEKMKLLRSPTGTPIMPSSMIPMEVASNQRISKKRTILGISN